MRNTRRAEPSTATSPRGNFTPPPPAGTGPSGTPDAEAAPAGLPAPGSRFGVRNWRVATRLNVILLIPVLVALVFGGFRVNGAVTTWRQADDAVRIAGLVRAAATYGDALEKERDATVVPLVSGRRNDPSVGAADAATDAAATAFEEAARHIPSNADLRRRLAEVRSVQPQLAATRKAAYTAQLSGVQTEERYVLLQHPLAELANELGYGTSDSASYGRILYSLSLAKSAESLTRSIGLHILVEKGTAKDTLALQKTALGSYQYLQGIARQEFEEGGTPQEQALLKKAQADAAAKGQRQTTAALDEAKAAGAAYVVPPDLATMVADLADPALTPDGLAQRGITPDSYTAAATLSFDAYRAVEVQLADQAASDAAAVASHAKRDVFVNSAIVLVALVIAFIVAALMARGMTRGMRRLRSAAFDIAETRLPGLVDQLSRTDPGRVDTQVAPIPLNTRDEIGEVARAFDQVHREAVRLAAEQALLRGNVNAIFSNLSMRNQSLIQRQLDLITELENNEADPDQLSSLFTLDHLATRMRRNGENLLVLAGGDTGRTWNQPVPLVDVLRAAASEVEAYDRIELVGVPEADIHGGTVTDLVHLLAELLENATSFSSPQTKVRVTATRLPDGRLIVEIHDQGIGLTAEDFADINHKLADPPTVDVEIAKRMGLFVVGRLSLRHGIRVQLRRSGELSGTTSLVMLPEAVTRGGVGRPRVEEGDFTVPRIAPEPTGEGRGPRPEAGGRTAAELGFDDSRYERPVSALDSLGRSLAREERRAQLEAAAAERYGSSPLPTHPGGQPPVPESGQEHGGYAAYGTSDGYTGYGRYDVGADGRVNVAGQAYPDQYGTGNGQAGGAGLDPAGESAGPAQPYPQPYPQSFTQPYAHGLQQSLQGPDAVPGQGPVQAFPQQSGPVNGQEQNGFPAPGGYDDGSARPYAPTGAAGSASSGEGGPAGLPERPGDVGQAGFPFYRPAQEGWPENGAGAPRNAVDAAQSVPPPPAGPSESVVSQALTDAGLPRRERQRPSKHVQERPEPTPDPHDAPQPTALDPRSANDEHWQRAEQVREPRAGGVTPSGLPRRVPRANLVPGAADQTSQGGPQVSRAPEDVRGRLSSLRRGVQQGRTAGTDSNGPAADSRFGGPHNQER
ncbi:sensor histidine kinase [Actinacidiphila yeochonensis]|uniref:sensor histidine kinase n=1 Tax=Actinacidiphila yeochonensis TaxID=89050 RepID=UPI00055BF016|nr:nitrate- and nitrite sensing domain-containing protein [Actinacidiphila yeochonensis]